MVTIRIRNWRPAMPSISGPRATVASTKPFTSKLTLWLGFDRVPACARTTAASWITRPWSSCGLRAVRQVEQSAQPEDVAAALGMTKAAVYGWLAKYREGGLDA